jgi:hypothetical protein
LLRDLNTTRVASSYLIKASVVNDTPPNTGAPFTRASRLHTKNKDVIPTFILPTSPPSSLSCYRRENFELNCFECELQGRIDLTLPADASNILNNSLSHHHTVTMLESTALHPFLISNVRKCFVYQQKNGDIYYMSFAPPKDEKDHLVSLHVFGVTELNVNIKAELKKVLEVKLTEYIANVISLTMVPRRTVLPTTHVQFLRDCGLSKRVEFVYQLPTYVSDPYFFCVLAKQLFSKSEIFMALTIQYTDRQEHISSYLHPAMYGYDDSRHQTEVVLGAHSQTTEKMNHEFIIRPHLERKKRVDEELCSELTVHPIFFDRKRQLQTPRNDRRNDASLIVWDQGDFTLLYNSQEKEKSKRNIAQKRAFTQSGGLALIEFQPLSEFDLLSAASLPSHPMRSPSHESTSSSTGKTSHSRNLWTGSEESLINDANRLVEHIKVHQNVQLEPAKPFEVPSTSAHSDENTLSQINDRLVVRIYPTRGINPKTLMEGLHTFFQQTLIYYSLERLFSVYSNPNTAHQRVFTPHIDSLNSNELLKSKTSGSRSGSGSGGHGDPNNSGFVPPMKQEVTPYANTQIASDLFESYHKLILHNTSDLLPYISHLNIQTRFSLSDAESLYHRILTSIITQFPHLVNYTILPIDNSIDPSKQASWLDPQEVILRDTFMTTTTKYSSCSCILGENFITIEGKKHPKDFYKWKGSARDGHLTYVTSDPHYSLEAVNGLRHIPDYVPDKSLLFPLWLRKRRYAIEVTLTSCGIDVFFFNIEKKHIDSIKTLVQDYSKEISESNLLKQLSYLGKINFTRIISHTILQQSTSSYLPIENNGEDGTLGLRERLTRRLSIQIQGLFWSQRVLSRLYLFTSNGLVTNPSGNLGNFGIQNELKDIPFSLWSEGILLKREYVPLPFYHSASVDQSGVACVKNFIEDYHQHLSHLLRSYDCYLLEEPDSHHLTIVLPIPHTSSVYVIQLTSFYSLYLGLTYRVADCADIIRSIAQFYDLDDPNSLLNPIICDHLECYPSIGSPSKEEIEREREGPDNQESRLNVMDLIYNDATIAHLNRSVLYSMLSTLYFQSYLGGERKGNGTRILATLK